MTMMMEMREDIDQDCFAVSTAIAQDRVRAQGAKQGKVRRTKTGENMTGVRSPDWVASVHADKIDPNFMLLIYP